jgi:hypothetical protein
LELKSVLANSPSLEPKPVKSKRSVAMPSSLSRPAMRDAAKMSLEQVKQWAKSAKARASARVDQAAPQACGPDCR